MVKEDLNNSKFIASIESPKNYVCNIPEIGDEFSGITIIRFHKDRTENWELKTKVSICTVYTHDWDHE